MRHSLAILGVVIAALICAPLNAQQPSSAPQPLTPVQRLDAWAAAKPNEPIQVGISFGRLLPDQQVTQLLERHRLRPYAVYMWVGGQTGTRRVAPSAASSAVIDSARSTTVTLQERSIVATKQRAEKYAADNPRDRVVGNEREAGRARGLLRRDELSRQVLAAARGNRPIIWGVEVVGSVADVRQFITNPAVAAYEPAAIIGNRVVVPRPQLPTDLRGAAQTPGIDTLNPGAVYDRLKQLPPSGDREN